MARNLFAGIMGILLLPLAVASPAPEQLTVLSDFETGLGNWSTEGDAFGVTAADTDRWNRSAQGEFFADSLHGGEAATGVLRSPQFPCPDLIRFSANGWDRRDGSGGRNFYRLRLADGTIIRETGPPLKTGEFVQMQWNVSDYKGRDVYIEVVDGAADGAFAWLAIDNVRLIDMGRLIPAEETDLYAIQPPEAPNRAEKAGIAFALWDAPPQYANGEHSIPIGCTAREIYLLGHISTYDRGCAHWGAHTDFTRDFTSQQMIGDRAGTSRIEYADGTSGEIPLIFGYTMWWDDPWRNTREPIKSEPDAKAAFDRSMRLKEVLLDGGAVRFISAIAPQSRPIERIVLIDSAAKQGCPRFDALSVRTQKPAPHMQPIAHHEYDTEWLRENRIALDDAAAEDYRPQLEALKRAVGMTDDQLPGSLTTQIPENFAGPRMKLSGNVFADIITNAYYSTAHGAATRSIRDDGYVHCAPPNMPNYHPYNSIGTYRIDSRGATSSWTRGYEYIRDLAEWGYVDRVTRAIDWTDSQLWFYPRECDLRYEAENGEQLPWPAHWATTADHPPCSLDPGHNEIPGDENDGHALTMMLRYSAWLATGKDIDWLRERWEPAVAAADWLCFVLDYTDQSALYCESEGTCYGVGFNPDAESPYDDYPHYDIFTNALGALALRQYADMADAIGDRDLARKWRRYAAKIDRGTIDKCVRDHPEYGTVWRVHPSSIWPQFDERLAPVFELPYYRGFDPAALDANMLDISRNSLRLQIGEPPDYHHGHGLGYGQGWITAAALLLDEMKTARHLLDNLARYLYFPDHPRPFMPTEGVVVNEDGDFRVRMGTMGIDEALFITRVFRVLMGVDDTNPRQIALMPRLPEGYDSIQVADHPITIETGGETHVGNLAYTSERTSAGCALHVSSDTLIPLLRTRLGPFNEKPQSPRMLVNGRPQKPQPIRSGDSWWIWADLGEHVQTAHCELTLGP